MPGNHPRGNRWNIACGVMVLSLLVLAGSIVGLYLLYLYIFPPASVSILQPARNLGVESGQMVVVRARGEASNGVQRIVFLVNNAPTAQQFSSYPGLRTLEAVFPWFSSRPGIHKLTVIAYNNLGIASKPATMFVVVTAKQAAMSRQLLLGHADGDDISQPPDENSDGSQPPEEDSGGAQVIGENNGAPLQQGEERIPGEVSISEQSDIDNLVSRIDEEDSFPVDLQGQPQDAPPEITSFLIETPVVGGNQLNGSYQIEATDDLGLAYIIFAVADMNSLTRVIEEPTTCGGETRCIHRGTFNLSQGSWLLIALAIDQSGQASPMAAQEIQVLGILEGDEQPAIAVGELINVDPDVDWDGVEQIDSEVNDIGDPTIANFICETQGLELIVPYTYESDHGQEIIIQAQATHGPFETVIAAQSMTIHPGSGTARFAMTLIEQPEMIYLSDKLTFFFIAPDSGGITFYEESFDLPITWPVPKPDLHITHADAMEASVQATVKNIGCAAVNGFELRFKHFYDGTERVEVVDHYLPPGGTVTLDYFGGDPNRYAYVWQVFVDPNDLIDEMKEDNNGYPVGAIMFKQVQVYRIDIANVSEDPWDDRGEFYIHFWVHGNRIRWPRLDRFYWSRGVGEHVINDDNVYGPIILQSQIMTESPLFIEVDLFEHDTLSADDEICVVKFLHPADVLQENSWKTGGEFSQNIPGKCTVYWRVIVERGLP